MPPKKKRLTEKALAERRNAKKLSMRRAREKLKANPEKHEEEKKKDRERKKAQRKSINEMTEREQRKIRKQWKVCSTKYRNKKKKIEEIDHNLEYHTPPSTPQSTPQNIPSTSMVLSGKKIRKKNNRLLSDKIMDLKEKNDKLHKQVQKYRKRLQRVNKIKDTDVSPRKKVAKLIKGQVCSKEIKKSLLFAEVLRKQIKYNFEKEKKRRKKNCLAKLLSGKIVKKYRYISRVAHMTSYRAIKESQCTEIDKESKIKLVKDSKEFFEMDEVSRLCPGKKDTITRGRIKMQKRYLNDSLLNLHLKFISCFVKYQDLSYSSFCKLRPFWVLIPDCRYRETCLCIQHANIELVIQKLYKLQMIKEKTSNEVLQSMTCAGLMREECLERTCKDCIKKNIIFDQSNNSDAITFQQWIKKEETVEIKGRKKLVNKTTKEEISSTKNNLICTFKNLLKKFSLHVSNIRHQYSTIRNIKENLTANEALLHMDFSENYNCKFNEEVQTFHFGGSRDQITLHTVVLYYCTEEGNIKSVSYCTLSEDRRHNSSAICAHLEPVLEEIKKKIPKLKTIHFLSDGPTSQYRNRRMFVLATNVIARILNVDSLHWHFSEAGHGKGAPDGIGGCLKRQADSLVARGVDLPNIKAFVTKLTECCKGINIFRISSDKVTNYEDIQFKPPLFTGVLKVHEICWWKSNSSIIEARRLSCLDCSSGYKCPHYLIGQMDIGN